MKLFFRKSGWHGCRSGDLEIDAAKATLFETKKTETSIRDILITIFLILIILG